MKREFKQIQCASTFVPDTVHPEGTFYKMVVAVATDGTAWQMNDGKWDQLPDLPQPVAKTIKRGEMALMKCTLCPWCKDVSDQLIAYLKGHPTGKKEYTFKPRCCPHCGSATTVERG